MANAVHPYVFKHQLSTYHGYVDAALKVGAVLAPIGGSLASMLMPARHRETPTSSRLSAASWVGLGTAAATAVGTAAVAALSQKDPMYEAYRWISEHASFVQHLWDERGMQSRLQDVEVPFHCFYTRLPGTPPRTFIVVPPASADYARHFTPLDTQSADEVTAHMHMFSLSTNSAYLPMGTASAALLAEWLPQAGRAPTFHASIPKVEPLD